MSKKVRKTLVPKKNSPWSFQTLGKYVLLQVPALMLVGLALLLIDHWVELSTFWFWGIAGGWLLKDIVLYPLVWKAYAPHSDSERNTLIGEVGVAVEPLCPSGYIEIRGELWHAQLAEGQGPIAQGQSVAVLDILGLTLVVEADPEKKV